MINKKNSITGSKSVINRLLCMALYHKTELSLKNMNLCNDVNEMLFVCKAIKNKCNKLKINEAGTALRFILPYLAFSGNSVCIELGKRLSERPIQALIDCLNNAGADIIKKENIITIKPHRFLSETLYLDTKDSSQFLSSLLMFITIHPKIKIILNTKKMENGKWGMENVIAPFLRDEGVAIHSLSSKPDDRTLQYNDMKLNTSYIKMTIDVLKKFNFEVDININELSVNPINNVPQKLNISLDPDYSTACYFWFYSFLMNKPFYIKKIGDIHQPDYYFIDVLKNIGINFTERNNKISVIYRNIHSPFSYHTLDMSDMPDQIITLAFWVLVSGISNKINISGCQRLSGKESDRLHGIIENIKLLGGEATYHDDILTIYPLQTAPKECELKTYYDHRFALTFIVLREKYPYLKIDNIDCIKKSYNL